MAKLVILSMASAVLEMIGLQRQRPPRRLVGECNSRRRAAIKAIGHYTVTIFLAVGVCAAAYGFLGAYALKTMHQEQLAAQQGQLRMLHQRQKELTRKEAILKQATRFTRRATTLGLQQPDWTFYDVNIQAPLGYEAAQEIIHQCSDSDSAYFWPISLEVKAHKIDPAGSTARAQADGPADVQLSVKGRFVAKR